MVSALHISTGVKISGAAHAALILWMVFGGLFTFERTQLEFTEVTVISGEEFEAMVAARTNVPEAVEEVEEPPVPEVAEVPDVPRPVEPEDTPPPEPIAPEETTSPEPAPPVQTEPVAPEPPARPDQPDGSSSALAPDSPPAPIDAPRVAPEPAAPPETPARDSDETQDAIRPDESVAGETPVEPQEATAPEAATTEIVTEATSEAGGTLITNAPVGSPRPAKRPENLPSPTPEPEAPVEIQQDEPVIDDAIAAAVAEAVASDAASSVGTGTAASGPPMSSGERDALRISVQRCWNVGSLSTDALATTVTVYVKMNENAKPENGSIRLVTHNGRTDIAAQQAFEAARRAIIRCGSSGFDLPPEKYAHWQEIEMVFNPEKMRIK